MKGDKQLESRKRGSEFTVSLTKALTPPSGWEVQYSRTAGAAAEINASQWLTAEQVSDWSEIRAVRWHSIAPVASGSTVQFNIGGAVIEQNPAPGARAYLSSAMANGSSKYTESNNVSIQMTTKLSTASFTFVDINNPSKEVQLGQVDTVVGKPNGSISYDPARRIKELEDAGYELISNDFTDHVFGDLTSPKQFKFQFRHKVIETIETVRGTRVINYKYYRKAKNPDLALLPPRHVESHSFTRTKRIDQVLAKMKPNDTTAGVTYSAWSADQTWSQVISPEIPGYYAGEDIDANTMSGDRALDQYWLSAIDQSDEDLEKEFSWDRLVYYVPLPVVPSASAAKSKGIQGQKQLATIRFDEDRASESEVHFTKGTTTINGAKKSVELVQSSVFLYDENGQKVTSLTIANQGTYELDFVNKTIVFTPLKTFYGPVTPVQVGVVDKNGESAVTTYAPVVEKVTPISTNATSTGPQGVPQTGTPTFQGGAPLVPIDETVEPTFEDGRKEKNIPGQGTYTIAPDGTVTFNLDKRFVGKPAPVTVKRVDKNGTPVTATYSPEFTKVTPTGTGDKTEGLQGQVQEGKVTFTPGHDSVPFPADSTPLFDNGTTVKEVPNVGKFEVDADGKVTFTPDKQFKGETPELELTRVDANGTPVTVKYQAVVKEVVPTSTNATSTGPQGVPQTGTPTFQGGNPLVPIDETVEPTFDDGSKEKSIPGQGTYTIAPEGSVTFTPDKQFVGTPNPVTVKRVDKNGTPVIAAYSPEFTKVTPTGTGDKTEGLQGQVQEGKVTFTPGHNSVPFPADSTPLFENGTTMKEVPNVGKFEVDADGTVTFTPDKQFKGETPELELTRVDANGTPVTVKYQAVVKEVVPTSTNATSSGPQGVPQTGTPTFQGGDPLVSIDETVEPTFEDGSKEKSIPGQGIYTIAPDGTVTFNPDKRFVGKPAPVTVKRVDKNGTSVTATYTPTVTKVTPTGTNTTSSGPQGLPQTGTPAFQGGDPLVSIDETVEPTFDDGSKEKNIPGQGTYTIAPDGTVTFDPDKRFVGKPAPVTVKRVDKNGTPVTATYSPEFTKVTPTGKDTSSVNIKGIVQTGTPTFEGGNPLVPIDETVAATFEDGSTEKVIPGEGTYVISPDGIVTFTPEANFAGKGTGVTIVRKDKNGTPVTASYRPTVVDPSTGHDTTSTGAKGQPQVATPVFEGHIDSTVPPTFEDGSTTMIVPGEGSYTIDKDGKITFTPEPDFIGTAKGLVVKRLDVYGNVVIAHYTPTVLGQPQVSDATSEGLKGQTQIGKPNFTGDVDLTVPPTFEDGTTEKVVPGEGTYVIPPDGTITFTPEADFVGQAKGVKVIRKDRNGNIISGFYTPTVVELPEQVKTSDKKELSVPDSKPDQLTQNISVEKNQLPNTGSQEDGLKNLGILTALAGVMTLGLLGKKKRNDESD